MWPYGLEDAPIQPMSLAARPPRRANASEPYRVSQNSKLGWPTEVHRTKEEVRRNQHATEDSWILRAATYVVAFVCTLDALFGTLCGTHLLTSNETSEFRLYLLCFYITLYVFEFIITGLLFVANRKGYLSLIVAWITIQILLAFYVVCGTALYVIKETLVDSNPLEFLVERKLLTTLYVSSLFSGLIILKMIGVFIVIQRYKNLTWKPSVRFSANLIPMENLAGYSVSDSYRESDTASWRMTSFGKCDYSSSRADVTQRPPTENASREKSAPTLNIYDVPNVYGHEPVPNTDTTEKPERSTLRQCTDSIPGLKESSHIDEYVTKDPCRFQAATYVVALFSMHDALFGVICGAFLLTSKVSDMSFIIHSDISEYQYGMLWAYVPLHVLALVSTGLLFHANKNGSLSKMVAWIVTQALLAVLIICGTALYAIKEEVLCLNSVQSLIQGPKLLPSLYFSSLFFGLVLTKIIGVLIVTLRCKTLTSKPSIRRLESELPTKNLAENPVPPKRECESDRNSVTDIYDNCEPVQETGATDTPNVGSSSNTSQSRMKQGPHVTQQPLDDGDDLANGVGLYPMPSTQLVVTADLHEDPDHNRGVLQSQALETSTRSLESESPPDCEPELLPPPPEVWHSPHALS